MAEPKYRELADELEAAIKSEATLLGVTLVDGAKLPTEPELAEHFQAARGTVRQALAGLAAEGLIETRGRAGTFVRRLPMLEYNVDSERPFRKDDTVSVSDTWSSVVEASGREPSQDFKFRIEPASATVAARLNIQPNDLVVVREMLRFVDDTPWSDQTTYYPYDVAKACGLDVPTDIPEGTVRRMAARGYVEHRVQHEISSRPASIDERRRFNLAPGVSVLLFRRLAVTESGTITRLTVEILPADRNVITHVTQHRTEVDQ
ncbi:GntR family transcriptional regulator [Kibdelosporangium banguiense]|uniref:GntR family transcriptional regulator n=1 Tax=Kibdelosporangium banguiense TaxID=1365924 RepID=A0ABS4TAU0_9PSEU|nr:GntR family transcriptional regulator [Kibdelosporangium banguiense]MBP2321542.1 GntR family transcriptional regulator [Kibdelosporangium banguiense]